MKGLLWNDFLSVRLFEFHQVDQRKGDIGVNATGGQQRNAIAIDALGLFRKGDQVKLGPSRQPRADVV